MFTGKQRKAESAQCIHVCPKFFRRKRGHTFSSAPREKPTESLTGVVRTAAHNPVVRNMSRSTLISSLAHYLPPRSFTDVTQGSSQHTLVATLFFSSATHLAKCPLPTNICTLFNRGNTTASLAFTAQGHRPRLRRLSRKILRTTRSLASLFGGGEHFVVRGGGTAVRRLRFKRMTARRLRRNGEWVYRRLCWGGEIRKSTNLEIQL